MPTLDDLLDQDQPREDDLAILQGLFAQEFDLDGWRFEQQGSIPYALLEGDNNVTLKLTAIPGMTGIEWQLNGISILFPTESSLDVETKRMRLVDAARRNGYRPKREADLPPSV